MWEHPYIAASNQTIEDPLSSTQGQVFIGRVWASGECGVLDMQGILRMLHWGSWL